MEISSLSGIDFEQYVGRLLVANYGERVVPVSSDYQGDWGCDFILPSECMVIQVFGPSHSGYVVSSYAKRVTNKIKKELDKIIKNRAKIENLLGNQLKIWMLIIPENPAPEVLRYAANQKSLHNFTIIIQGKTHLEELERRAGFDPNDTGWLRLRETMAKLEDTSVYGEGTLKELYREPEIIATIPIPTGNTSHLKFANVLDFLEDFVFERGVSGEYRYFDSPVVLFGEYGIGKSSSLRMLSSRLAKKTTHYPVFIPLREAILNPYCNTLYIESAFMKAMFFYFKLPVVLNLGTSKILQSVFKGGTIILMNKETRCEGCVFVNCRIIGAFPDLLVFSLNSVFIDCEFISVDVTTGIEGPKETVFPTISTAVEKTFETLSNYCEKVKVSHMVPWGNALKEKMPNFEKILFPHIMQEDLLFHFDSLCHQTSRQRE